jgi:hypothetical protein
MNGTQKSKFLVWLGPVFAVLFLAADFLVGDGPGEKASGAKVVAFYNAHQGRTLVAVFGAAVLAALLILFVGELRSRARGSGDTSLATVMVAGAVVWVGGMLLGAVLDLGLASSADHHQQQVAQTMNVLSNDSWIPFIAGIAIFLVGAGGTVLKTGLLPKWLGWVALVGGVISLAGPGGFVGFFLAPLWIIVAGIMLGARSSAHGETARQSGRSRSSASTIV